MLDETGRNLGIAKIEEALQLAAAKGLDLVEIGPNAKPPVVRIISFDKFRYQKEKEEKRQKQSQQARDLKQVRITPRMAANDLRRKRGDVEEFLAKGHRVEINMSLKGREKAHRDIGLQKLKDFVSIIETPYTVTLEPKSGGRGFITQITKK